MTQPGINAGVSLLDEAYGKRVAGDSDGALRRAIAILEADPGQLGAGSLIASILVERERSLVAGEAAARLVEGLVRRGDLPAATVAADIGRRAGEGSRLFGAIADAFGHGSKRLADVPPAPPPLPAGATVTSALEKLKGDALLDRADDALRKLLASDDAVAAGSKVPTLPLFSSLAPRPLERLLSALELRDAAAGAEVVHQGDLGHEAFVVVRGMLEVVRHDGDADAGTTLAALGPGAIFGEMALVSEAPRAASVLAVEPVQLLVATREQLEEIAASEPAIARELGAFCRNRMVSNLLRHSAILGAVAEAERPDLMGRFTARTFEPGDALVRAGEETQGLYLIASGEVEVTSVDEDGDRIRIAELGPGDVVGEISLVLRRPATADVIATHPTVALELTRDAFREAIQAHPALLNELYDLATKREEETRSVVAQEALDVDDVVIL